MKALFRAAAIGALITVTSAGASLAQSAPVSAADTLFRATTLNLAAYGEVSRKPDMATISTGVQTEAPTAAEALRLNAVRMNQVIAALKRGGIADRDIQTSGLSLNPQYVYQENLPPKLTGYQASNQVTIVVRDLTKLGQAVDAVVGAGANTVGGISFGLQSSDAANDAARHCSTTSQPWLARCSVMLRPMRRAAPVTSATGRVTPVTRAAGCAGAPEGERGTTMVSTMPQCPGFQTTLPAPRANPPV